MKKIILFVILSLSVYATELIVVLENNVCSNKAQQYYISAVVKRLAKTITKDGNIILVGNNGDINEKFLELNTRKRKLLDMMPKLVRKMCHKKKKKSRYIFDTKNMLDNIGDYIKGREAKVLIFSNLGYFNKEYKIDSYKKVMNDAWITSDRSPFYETFQRYKSSQDLKNTEFIVITQNQYDLKKYKQSRRFYYLFFKELGSRLKYYGEYGSKMGQYDLIEEYFTKKSYYDEYYKNSVVNHTILLQLDSDNYNVDLRDE